MDILKILNDSTIPKADYCTLIDSDNALILYYPKENAEIDLSISLIEHTLDNFNIDEVHIICFGNRLYGGLLPKLWDKYPSVRTKIMICSPKATAISYNTQYFIRASRALEAQLKKVIEHNNISEENKTELHVLGTPSTLRACVLYSNGKPILTSYQRYTITTERVKGKQHTPCFIACRTQSGNNFILNSLSNNIADEFKSMQKSEVSVKIDERGELSYDQIHV